MTQTQTSTLMHGGEQIEHARESTFPGEWGIPPGTTFSEERATWVRERVQEHQALTEVRRKAQEVARAMTQPAIANVRRQRQLLLARKTVW